MSRVEVYLRSGRTFGVLSVALALASVIAGCGGGSTTPKQTASGAVTPEAGGTVKLADDSVKLDVPPGAVPANTTIKMTTTDAAAPQGITAASPILQFEPDGIVFAKPITVTFTFKNATKPIVYWSNHSGGYDLIPGTVSGSTISAPVTHFSMGFVGEEPAGSTDTCGAGVACGAGTSCGYGGTPNGDGSGTPADASVNAGGGGTQTSGGGSPAGAADASAPSSTGDQAGAASSPLSSGAGGTGTCCSCINGTFQCSTCSAPVGGGDDAGAPVCVEGASCSQPGAACGGTPTTSGGGGSTNSGGGGSTNSGTGPSAGAADASVSRAGSAGSCCMCGTDGKVHCGLTCTPSAGLDGGANNADATTNGGGGSGGKCEPGDPCQASAAPCRNASPSSCLSCMCGADGTLACMPCDDAPPPPPDGGAPAQCASGAKCQPGSGGCESTSSGTCLQCRCDANGVLACAPCGSANDAGVPPPPPSDASTGPSDCVPHGTCAQGAICDAKGGDGQCMTCKCDQTGSYQCVPCAGTQPPPDGGAAPPPPSCVQGGACLAEGMLCDAKSPDGGCMTCKCGADGTYQCGSCAGAPPPPSDASAPPPPQACVQGAKCPSPGATCGGADGAGACTQCTCSVDGILSCKPCP